MSRVDVLINAAGKPIEQINGSWVKSDQLIVKTNKPISKAALASYLNKSSSSRGKGNSLLDIILKMLGGNPLGYTSFPNAKVEEENISRCCWDPTLNLITNKDLFESYKVIDPNSSGGTMMQPESSGGTMLQPENLGGNLTQPGGTDGTDITDGSESNGRNESSGGTMLQPESSGGTMLQAEVTYNHVLYDVINQGGEDQVNLGEYIAQKCDERRKLHFTRCQKDNSKCKGIIKVGIVDFGFSDPSQAVLSHADLVNNIILKANDEIDNSYGLMVKTYDYSVTSPQEVSDLMSLCCQIARGIYEGMDILNMSLGYTNKCDDRILKKFIKKASRNNILIITSAGNESSDNDKKHHWPSNFSEDYCNVVAMGSLEKIDNSTFLAAYSNYGNCTVTNYDSGSFDSDGKVQDNIGGQTQVNSGTQNPAYSNPTGATTQNSVSSSTQNPGSPVIQNQASVDPLYKGTSFSAAYTTRKISKAFLLYGKENFYDIKFGRKVYNKYRLFEFLNHV